MMDSDESLRHATFTRLEGAIGQPQAGYLMERVPRVASDQVATKADIAQLEQRMHADFARLEGATKADIAKHEQATMAEIERFEQRMQADFARLEQATKAEIERFEQRMQAAMEGLEQRVTASIERTVRGAMTSQIMVQTVSLLGVVGFVLWRG